MQNIIPNLYKMSCIKQIRLELLDDEVNLKSLRTVESSIFCIALTDKVSNVSLYLIFSLLSN